MLSVGGQGRQAFPKMGLLSKRERLAAYVWELVVEVRCCLEARTFMNAKTRQRGGRGPQALLVVVEALEQQ